MYLSHYNMQRSEAEIWRPKSMIIFFLYYTAARRYTKNAQIFNITSQVNASSDEGTQWDGL